MYKKMVIFLIVWLPSVCEAQSELLKKYINIQHERLGFNGVVLVTKNNEELYRINVGKASQELQVSFQNESVFKIASITKQFTGMLLVMAVEEGKLSLHDSLALFFPKLTDKSWRKVTIHHLLTHTSGIPHNEGIPDYWTIKSRLPSSKENALAEIFSMKLLFEPGTDFRYSSPGYFLIACILESVYNDSFESILYKKILQPLKMEHSGVYNTGRLIPGMVPGYHLLGDSLIASPFREISLMKGCGDMYSNADDLSRWNNSFYSDTFWSQRLQQLIFTYHTKKPPYYGYGWYIRPGKRIAYYHGGGSFGCSAISVWYPDEKISVVILSNVSVLPVTELWNDIEKLIFNEPFTMPVVTKAIQLSLAQLQAFVGKYTEGNHELNIFLINDRLNAKLGTNMPFEIFAENSYKFYGKKVNIRFNFKTAESGEISGLDAEVRGQVLHFNKVK
jgi:CubicO group peptidase (beta-lactamase class C family)